MNTEKYIARCEIEISRLKEEISNGRDVNKRDRFGRTLLFSSHSWSLWHPEFLQWLIDHGGDVNAKDKHGSTPLHTAYVYPEIAHILILNGADVNALDDLGYPPFFNSVGLTPHLLGMMEAHGLNMNYRAPDGTNMYERCDDEVLKQQMKEYMAPVSKDNVGVFFYINGQFLFSGCNLMLAEDNGLFINYPRSHDEVWQESYAFAHKVDFDYYPRGRVVYRKADKKYLIYYDKCLESCIYDVSELYGECNVELSLDEHYQCHICNEHYVV